MNSQTLTANAFAGGESTSNFRGWVIFAGITLLVIGTAAVIYDVTHSLQLPGAGSEESGGVRRYAEPLARAAVAAGADGVFLEVHDNPAQAKSDGANALDLKLLPEVLDQLIAIHTALRHG